MAKKKNWFEDNIFNFIWSFLIIALLIGVYWAYTVGLYPFVTQTYFASDRQDDILNSASNPDCTLTITPSTIDFGAYVTGIIWTKNPNTFCEIFARQSSDDVWRKIAEGTTDIDGNMVGREQIYVAGDFIFAALCGDCRTNNDNLHVNPEIVTTCTDTDGINKMTPGHVTSDGISYYDDCAGNWAVIEYYCNGDTVDTRTIACDPGYICTETRSGDYCGSTTDDDWGVGDVVGTESGSGLALSQVGKSNVFTIDGWTSGGPYLLGVKIYRSWTVPEACPLPQRYPVQWRFFDSSGLAWTVDDFAPTTEVVELCPVSYNEEVPWNLEVYNAMDCAMNFEWEVKAFVCGEGN